SRSSWTSPTTWWSSTTVARSPTARPTPSAATPPWSKPTSANDRIETGNHVVLLRSPHRRSALGRHVLDGGAGVRAHLQGVGRLQLRPGRDGALLRAHVRHRARARPRDRSRPGRL